MPVRPNLRRNERQISDGKNAKSQSIRLRFCKIGLRSCVLSKIRLRSCETAFFNSSFSRPALSGVSSAEDIRESIGPTGP
eukprot:scaffold14629_cov116-Isochrysis_galbana.AAC.6